MHMLAIQTLSRARAALMPTVCLLISTVTAAQAQQAPGVPSHQERGNLIFEGIPPLDTALAARLERYQQSRQATFLDWQADGSMLVATRFGEVEQVHRITAPLGMRQQLTFSPDPVSGARAPGTGNGFVFLKDHGGDEKAQVFYYG
jgi:hypothetical protein